MRIVIAVALVMAATGMGWGGQARDVRGWNPQTDANDVIDARCKTCHSRQRVDSAAEQKRNMLEIVRKMEQKGLVLTEREREVLGVFGQSPFKKTKP